MLTHHPFNCLLPFWNSAPVVCLYSEEVRVDAEDDARAAEQQDVEEGLQDL